MGIQEIKQKYMIDGRYNDPNNFGFKKGQKVFVVVGGSGERAYPTKEKAEEYIKMVNRPGMSIKEDVYEGPKKKTRFKRF